MRKRIPLKLNTKLRCMNRDSGTICYYVGEPIGCGGTCIVYDGYYIDNEGNKKPVRIKECYPYKLHISRLEENELFIEDKERSKFKKYTSRLRKSYEVMSELFRTSGLTNSISNTLDIYELNNTVYIILTYAQGQTLAEYDLLTLKDAVKVAISTAKSVGKIHDKGYLYLDIKPENILVYEETKEIVQLFDFDSVVPINACDDILDYRISYSRGFSPIEQKKGDLSRIGMYSDVYSIGALLFFLVFGKVPTALDCENNAVYDFESMCWKDAYQDKLFHELSTFFANTVHSYYKDRYSSMEDVEKQLLKVLKYADLSKAFIHSSVLPENEFCVGRKNEILKLDEWLATGSKCVFVTGMGGIGKSTVVRKWLGNRQRDFDAFVYLYVKDSICQAIADDENFYINNFEKNKEESAEEYFRRKLKGIRKICTDNKVVLVLDNFNGNVDDYLLSVLKAGASVIAITRKDMSKCGYPQIEIGEIKDHNYLYDIFAKNLGKPVVQREINKVEKIIKLVSRHTLSIELIAKQISNSYLDFDEAIKLMIDNGFSEIASEKVETYKDGKRFYDKFGALISAVYDARIISEKKQNILKILSLFDAPGITVRELQNLMQIESLDEINEMKETGWIYVVNGSVYLHPLVQETIHQIKWNDEARTFAKNAMRNLLKVIKLNNNGNLHANHKLLEHAMINAKSMVNYCGRDEVLSKEEIYKDLMYITVINSHKDQEEYIIKYTEIMLHDKECQNPYAIMELYDYVVYIYCQRGDFESADKKLNEALAFAKKQKNNHLWGLYYDMMTDFYETILDGAYMYQNQDEQEVFERLLAASDKAIHYMSKSEYETSKGLLAKYLLGKAGLIIRSFPEEVEEIIKLIKRAKAIIEEYSDYSKVCAIYYMTLAWFFTLCEPDMDAVLYNLESASKIHSGYGISELDRIDDYYIPAANMMCEIQDTEKSLAFLSEAISVCKANDESIPFMRKELDLYSYMLEVYYGEGDYAGCKKIIDIIEDANIRYSDYGIYKEISEEFRKAITL